MPLQTYDSFDLIGVIESLENAPITFLRDRYFGTSMQFETETVHFDMLDKSRRIAPFVSPLVKGKVIEKDGYTTKYFRPAYIKPKAPIRPTDALKRLPGEALGGSLSLAERRDAHIRQALISHLEMLDMREEVMASEILRTGKLTITGEGFGTVVLDFGRHAQLTKVLTNNDRWNVNHADAKPLEDLEAWAALIRTHSNAVAREVILEPTAWTALKARLTDAEKTILFNSLRGSQSVVELGPRVSEKVQFVGTIGDFNFTTYQDTYTDNDGNSQDVMPAGSVILASSAVEGVRAYGAIMDAASGLQAVRTFPKMWMEEDPSVEWLMTQSAPVAAVLRPNASLGAKVF